MRRMPRGQQGSRSDGEVDANNGIGGRDHDGGGRATIDRGRRPGEKLGKVRLKARIGKSLSD